ncbi:MAG: 2'-5' RNA ligase family protein [Treponema sp.]|nr:2'-5' RNA ligase family protein [Treponema sp.]
MKATFALLANNDLENYAKKLALKAQNTGKLGFEACRLPFHVSLKQPFDIPNLDSIEKYFDSFVKSINPITIHFTELDLYKANIMGNDSGVLSIKAERTKQLDELQKIFFAELDKKFGDCKAEHDDDYVFHMTISYGLAPSVQYDKVFNELKGYDYNFESVFSQLGLFYYEDFKPGAYFCYKKADII